MHSLDNGALSSAEYSPPKPLEEVVREKKAYRRELHTVNVGTPPHPLPFFPLLAWPAPPRSTLIGPMLNMVSHTFCVVWRLP